MAGLWHAPSADEGRLSHFTKQERHKTVRQILSSGIVIAAAATGILSAYGAPAFADAGAEGQAAGSPGIASGNTVQVPVHVPVNVCGNTIDIIGLLNPAVGNTCVNGDIGEEDHGVEEHEDHGDDEGGYGHDEGGYGHDEGGYGKEEGGYGKEEGGYGKKKKEEHHKPHKPERAQPQAPAEEAEQHVEAPSHEMVPQARPALAQTGSETPVEGAAAAALIAGGVFLYRRGRAMARR
jgi:ChpA-C